MISNEFSLPYLTKTEPITAITMARIIGELLPALDVPYGVNVLWDGRASIDLAVATGAKFVREIFTGVYASDFGLWDTNVGEVARHRARVGGSRREVVLQHRSRVGDLPRGPRPRSHHAHHGVRHPARRDLRVRGDRRSADRRRGTARGQVGGGRRAGVRQHRCAGRERGRPARRRRRRHRRHVLQEGRHLREPGRAVAGRGADGPRRKKFREQLA